MEKEYLASAEDVLEAQSSNAETGLTGAVAQQRLSEFGPNKLDEEEKTPLWKRFFEQMADPMVIMLIVAAAISAITGTIQGEPEWADVIIILTVVVINSVLGVVQEAKSEQALAALQEMSAAQSKVIRDGRLEHLPSADLVPGDIVLLEAGDSVPADCRIIESASMKIEEAALTGESVPVEKHTEPIVLAEGTDDVPLGDRKNMCYMGSTVVYGRGTAVVAATGMKTEMGKIADALTTAKKELTPLQIKLNELSGILTKLVLGICVVIFAVDLIRHGGELGSNPEMILDTFMVAVSLAVAAIPEGLVAVVTIVLSMGVTKMSKRQAIIRKMTAVETLGCTQIICSDKTGTLTQNKMTPQKIYADGALLDGKDLHLANDVQHLLLKAALLASDATNDEVHGTSIGDPTEVALVMLGEQFGVVEEDYRAQHPRLSELAFDSDRKLMSTLHDIEGVPTLYTKGAIDVLLDRSSKLLTSQGAVALTAEKKAEIFAVNQSLSEAGLRVLAFAEKALDSVHPLTLDDEQDLTFIGLISMIDPPRPEAVAAVADAKTGGIRTIMITGDHKVTATAIAKELGIFQEGDEALSGVELDQLDDAALDQRLEKVSVYARVSPEHKIRIVDAWQRRGKIVAMTGDGVNDAPALKKADIGVAMGITGTEVSKDAAAMILADDNFATIVKAVVNGRSVYENIKNAIQFLLSGNAAGIFCVLYASLLALPVPFQPVHLLFINLLTDSLPAIAIGMEPARSGLLHRKPRDPKAPILSKGLLGRIGLQGLLIAIVTMAAFYLGYQGGDAALASTMAFATLTLARLFHGFNCRGAEPIFRLKFSTNPYSVWAFLAGVVLLIAVLIVPGLQGLFQVSPSFALGQLAQCLGLAILPTVIIQIVKAGKTRQAGG